MKVLYFKREEHKRDGPAEWSNYYEGFYIPDKRKILFRPNNPQIMFGGIRSTFLVTDNPVWIEELNILLSDQVQDSTLFPNKNVRYNEQKIFQYSEEKLGDMLALAERISADRDSLEHSVNAMLESV